MGSLAPHSARSSRRSWMVGGEGSFVLSSEYVRGSAYLPAAKGDAIVPGSFSDMIATNSRCKQKYQIGLWPGKNHLRKRVVSDSFACSIDCSIDWLVKWCLLTSLGVSAHCTYGLQLNAQCTQLFTSVMLPSGLFLFTFEAPSSNSLFSPAQSIPCLRFSACLDYYFSRSFLLLEKVGMNVKQTHDRTECNKTFRIT